MATLNDLFAVNGQSDEQEPWTAADDCDVIEFHGSEIVALCEDGVARWSNSDREWSEVDGYTLGQTVQHIYDSGRGGNASQAATFAGWMERFWEIPTGIRIWLGEGLAEEVEARVHREMPETVDMPREVLCDYLQDLARPEYEVLLKAI